ncbi:MAG: hypothetical protein GX754_09340 [Clostridiaceae bacterium]|nr:hypothetical protein [Clostridiaceae bacterium]
MLATILKYRTVFIILGFAILVAGVILLITLVNRRVDEIPLRGIFVEGIKTTGAREAGL